MRNLWKCWQLTSWVTVSLGLFVLFCDYDSQARPAPSNLLSSSETLSAFYIRVGVRSSSGAVWSQAKAIDLSTCSLTTHSLTSSTRIAQTTAEVASNVFQPFFLFYHILMCLVVWSEIEITVLLYFAKNNSQTSWQDWAATRPQNSILVRFSKMHLSQKWLLLVAME